MVEKFDDFFDGYYEEQFEWYDKKAQLNKKWHRRMKITQITLAAILPVSVSLFPVASSEWWQAVIIISSVLLIIIESLESYLNHQKKWLNYRTTAEGLREEKQRFKTKVGEYAEVEDPERLFVNRVLSLTSQENKYWELTTRKAQEA